MNLLDLMEQDDPVIRVPDKVRNHKPPSYYYPTMNYNMKYDSHEVMRLLETGNIAKLKEWGVRYYNAETHEWNYWTTVSLANFKKTARPFPRR